MRLKVKSNIQTGFTLIEILISIGILIPALIMVHQIIFNYYETYNALDNIKNINYIFGKYSEQFDEKEYNGTKSLSEEIKLNGKIYKVEITIHNLDIKELLSKNESDNSLLDKYRTYLVMAAEMKELIIKIITPAQQEYEFRKIKV